MCRFLYLMALVSVPLLCQGCAIGYNSLLFVTKTNAGVDIDSIPPTMEISISRHEGVIEPTFEQGKTLPVMAGFRFRTKGLRNIFFGTSSTFATGRAAAAMAQLYDSAEHSDDTTQIRYDGLCLSQKPAPEILGSPVAFPGKGDVVPVIFSTDTLLGFKVEWNGQTVQYPSAVKLGYNRKEFAWSPVTYSGEQCEEGGPEGKGTSQHRVDTTSLLASLDSTFSVNDSETGKAESGYLQYFATGEAATQLALKQPVREAMIRAMNPQFVRQKFAEDESAKRLQAYIKGAPDTATRKERQEIIKNWIPEEAKYNFADLLYRADLEPDRKRFLNEHPEIP